MMQKKPIKALTIRKLPDQVADAVWQRAKEGHMSLSKALVTLLEERLFGRREKKAVKRDLRYMVGSLSPEDIKNLEDTLTELRRIDPEMWK